MDLNNFNWQKHSGDGNTLVDAGPYLCWVKSFKRNHERGSHQIDFTFGIGVNCRTGVEVDGVCWETITLSENAVWRLGELFQAAAAPTTVNLNSDRDLARAIKGKPFRAQIMVDEYRGKTKNKVDRYEKMTAEDRQLLPKLEASMSDSGGGYGPDDPGDRATSSNQGGRGGQSDWGDDDIPF